MSKKNLQDQINDILIALTKEQNNLKDKILDNSQNNNEKDLEINYIAITKNIDILKLIERYLDIYNTLPMQWLLWIFNDSIINLKIYFNDKASNINDLRNQIIEHSQTRKLLIFLREFYAILSFTLVLSIIVTLILFNPLAANIGLLLAIFIPILELFLSFNFVALLKDTEERDARLRNLSVYLKTLKDGQVREQVGYDFIKNEIDEDRLKINKDGMISYDNKFVFRKTNKDNCSKSWVEFFRSPFDLIYTAHIKINDNTKIFFDSKIPRNFSSEEKQLLEKCEKKQYLTGEERGQLLSLLNWNETQNNLTIDEAKEILIDFKKKYQEENKKFYLEKDSNRQEVKIIEQYTDVNSDKFINNQQLFRNSLANKIIQNSINKSDISVFLAKN